MAALCEAFGHGALNLALVPAPTRARHRVCRHRDQHEQADASRRQRAAAAHRCECCGASEHINSGDRPNCAGYHRTGAALELPLAGGDRARTSRKIAFESDLICRRRLQKWRVRPRRPRHAASEKQSCPNDARWRNPPPPHRNPPKGAGSVGATPLLHNGILSCFFQGFSSFLFLSVISARMMRLRVSRGMMTSSM